MIRVTGLIYDSARVFFPQSFTDESLPVYKVFAQFFDEPHFELVNFPIHCCARGNFISNKTPLSALKGYSLFIYSDRTYRLNVNP